MSDDAAGHDAPDLPLLLADARAWRDQDPDEVTRTELDDLISRAGDDAIATEDLRDRFGSRLEFGTAGLRGALGAGPARMNRVLVSQAAAGLAAWLLDREPRPSIVIGYDGRTNSRVFAIDTAELMQGAGVQAILLPRLLPTPVLAFAVRHFGTSAGVMVTASHNPAADNGYKVYLGGADGGSQIVPPADGGIADRIHDVASSVSISDLPRSTAYRTADDAVLDEYVRRTALLAGPTPLPSPPKVVYTAMHGVGWETAKRVFDAAGLPLAVSVPEQQEPDAAFPTVVFPNPEEPGALDLAIRTAIEVNADLVIANDPDADRLAIAIPSGDGTWRTLRGNEVGALLGWRAAERMTAATTGSTAPAPSLAASLVSSPALRTVAEAYGLSFAETLTGFKWISRTPGLAFGFEEALGYLVDPGKVRDKDGISAALDFLAMATELRASGRSVGDRLEEFAERFGAFASGQISIRVTELTDIPRIMRFLRHQPPAVLGTDPVATVEDFLDGVSGFPPSDILRYTTHSGARVIVRPSGTEPKLKFYLDTRSTDGSGPERIAAAEASVAALEPPLRVLVDAALS